MTDRNRTIGIKLLRLLVPSLWVLGSVHSPTFAQQVSPRIQTLVPNTYADRPQLRGKATVVMQLKLAKGGLVTVTLELNGEAAPVTAGHFADLVQQGFYNNLTFQRVIKDPEPFLVQGGEPKGSGGSDPLARQPRTLPLEILVKKEKMPRYNSILDGATSGRDLVMSHKRGAIAMARSNAMDSASSQFYISLASLPTLDGRYAVFGSVVEGMNWVDQISVGDVILSAKVTRGVENLIYPPKSSLPK